MRENSENSGRAALWTAFVLLVLVVGWLMTGGQQFWRVLSATTGFAFAAFCIWLTVRLFNRGERWAKRTAAGLTIGVVAYSLSFPLVLFTLFLTEPGARGVQVVFLIVYSPLIWLWSEWPVLGWVLDKSMSPMGLAVAFVGVLATGIIGMLTAGRWFKENRT